MRGTGLFTGLRRRATSAAAGPVIPATAVRVPVNTGFILPATELTNAGTLSDVALALWLRVDSRPKQYLNFFRAESVSSFLWFGIDFNAGGGLRNIGFHDGAGGGHGLGAYPANGVWTHIAICVKAGVLRAWLNKVPVEWDTFGGAPGHTDAPLLLTTWAAVTHIRFANPLDDENTGFDGAVRALWMSKANGLFGVEEVTALYDQSSPLLDDWGNAQKIRFPLATSADLDNDGVGGPVLTLEGGPLGTDTTGPTAITEP